MFGPRVQIALDLALVGLTGYFAYMPGQQAFDVPAFGIWAFCLGHSVTRYIYRR